MQVAEWADGSRAVLDPRGLLHLQSSDPDIPEATIVLHDDELAVWCSDGRVIGSEYFFLDDVGQRTGPIEILHDVIGAFARHVTKYRKSRGLAPQNSELAE